MIGKPKVAVLDELTRGSDPQARRDTWSLVQESWLGVAPDPPHLGVPALVAVAAGTVAAKSFRWE